MYNCQAKIQPHAWCYCQLSSEEIFISYEHTDRPIASRFAEVIAGYGFTVWWDHALLAGDDYRLEIAEKIRMARVALVLLSARSVHSAWVLDEAARAYEAGKLVPVRTEEVDIPLGLGGVHHLDIFEPSDIKACAQLESLLAVIERNCSRKRSPYRQVEIGPADAGDAHGPHARLRDRFHVAWLPTAMFQNVMVIVWPVYLLALLVALVGAWHDGSASPKEALLEWARLIHIYSGMLVFGGGTFLMMVFRLSDQAPMASDRSAITDVTLPLLSGWRIAACLQLVTGTVLVWANHLFSAKWVIQSVILYMVALYFWWDGFGYGLVAAEGDALYRGKDYVQEQRQRRGRSLFWAIFLTAWVLITMIYKDRADIGALLDSLTLRIESWW